MENVPMPFEGRKADIARYLDGGFDVEYVANKCECTSHYVYEVMKSAQFQDWQRGLALAELHGIGARAAIKTLIEVTRDKKAPKQSRVSAADKLLHYTGYNISPETGMLVKSPGSMTQEEIRQRLHDLQSEMANRSKPAIIDGDAVDVSPDSIADLLS